MRNKKINPSKNIWVEGTLFGRPFQTYVDHELAKTMLTNRSDSSVIQLFSNYSESNLDTETLSEITKKYSFDVATLFFIEKLYEQAKNKEIQDFYLSTIDDLSLEDKELAMSFLKDYFIVFVPGFKYKNINNGGNFLKQRRLLDAAGIAHEMIDIGEVGRVYDNAKIVATRLQELCRLHDNIIVISVSKGGLETAIAMNELIDLQNISSIKAWLNVGGTLKGTPVADKWSKPLMYMWLAFGLFWARIKIDLKGVLFDLSYKRGKEKYKSLDIPTHIYIVNLLAVSIGNELNKKSEFTSPNDRFSPLPDAIAKDGAVVMEMGIDHFFKNVDLNTRMIILLQYIVKQLNK